MSDTGQSDRLLRGAGTAAVLTDENALEYWIARAEWLNTAKLRILTDHFRRDVPADSLNPSRAR
jgi:hypothetical protein